jgi:hypothetical protein
MTAMKECFGEMTTQKAGSAGDKNFHSKTQSM